MCVSVVVSVCLCMYVFMYNLQAIQVYKAKLIKFATNNGAKQATYINKQ